MVGGNPPRAFDPDVAAAAVSAVRRVGFSSAHGIRFILVGLASFHCSYLSLLSKSFQRRLPLLCKDDLSFLASVGPLAFGNHGGISDTGGLPTAAGGGGGGGGERH